MNHELAEQLKDAGYPQPNLYGFPVIGPCIEDPYRPTLSELIEACGREFALESLYGEEKWVAHVFGRYEDRPKGEGSTPEEAIASLWLALNNKMQ